MHPEFLVIGAPRCGTTTVHRNLGQHPDIHMPKPKEAGYFAFAKEHGHPPPHNPERYLQTWDAYQAYYGDTDQLCGEATPFYMFFPHALDAIKERVPNCKLIVILRDPVERAISHYNLHLRKGTQAANFMAAWNGDEMQPGGWTQQFALQEFGMYGKALQEVYARFPREQVHVVWFDQLKHTQKVVQGMWAFLGLEPVRLQTTAVMNRGGKPTRWMRYHQSNHWTKGVVKAVLPAFVHKRLWRGLKARAHHKVGVPRRWQRVVREHYAEDTKLLTELVGRPPWA